MENDSTKYVLEMTPAQAKILVDALDMYARIGTGQLEMTLDPLRFDGRVDAENLRTAAAAMAVAKKIIFQLDPNAGFSICDNNVPEKFRAAFDLECVIRKQIATTEKHGIHSVWHNDPLHNASNVPLAKCEVKREP